MRRLPSAPRVIREISPEDRRVKIFGTIVKMEPAKGKLSLDDSTGVIDVFFNSIEIIDRLENYKVGDTVLVIGWAGENGIDGEILRRVSGFEPERYRNVLEVWKDVRSKAEQSVSSGGATEGGLRADQG